MAGGEALRLEGGDDSIEDVLIEARGDQSGLGPSQAGLGLLFEGVCMPHGRCHGSCDGCTRRHSWWRSRGRRWSSGGGRSGGEMGDEVVTEEGPQLLG